MKHYVLLKFKSGCFNDAMLNYTRTVFDEISKLEGIEYVKIHKNCISRDSNMDLMIEMKIGGKEILKSYLKHELHISFANAVNDYLLSKVSFDCE